MTNALTAEINERLPATDIGDLIQLSHQAIAARSLEGLKAHRQRAVELGHPGLLAWTAHAYNCVKEGKDPFYSDDKDSVSQNEKLLCLKRAIGQQRGNVFAPNTAIGSLYRELFWDNEVEGQILPALSTLDRDLVPSYLRLINHNLGAYVQASKNVNEADENLQSHHKGLVQKLIETFAQRNTVSKAIVTMAKAVGETEFLEQAYDPLLTRLANDGRFADTAKLRAMLKGEQESPAYASSNQTQ